MLTLKKAAFTGMDYAKEEPWFWKKNGGSIPKSLVGFLEGYELFNDVKYFEAFQAIWKFVDTKMINHEVGEWRRLLDRDGNVIDGNIGNEWKVAYHSGRSMVECEKRLNKLMKSE